MADEISEKETVGIYEEQPAVTSSYHCGIPGCNGDSRYDPAKKLKFHSIPKEDVIRRKWLQAIEEGLGEPLTEAKINSKNTKICSRHFYITDYCKTLNGHIRLRKEAVPHFPPNQTWAQNKGRKRRNVTYREESSEDENDMGITCIPAKFVNHQQPPGRSDHGYCLQPSDKPTTSNCGRPSPQIVIESDQITMKEVLDAAIKRNHQLEKQIELWRGMTFSVERFTNDPEIIDFYTGFKDYATFKTVYVALQPTAERMLRWSTASKNNNKSEKTDKPETFYKNEKISLIDQFFLFLFRVRRGWISKDLANRFKVSTSTVSRMIITWTNYLYFMLGSLPLWMPKEANLENMPEIFKKTPYNNTRVILTAHDLKIQKPSSRETNSDFYSSEKDHTSLRGLIATDPCGAVVFVSTLYTGNISDRELVIRSGIMELIEANDEVMLEKEFPISDVVALKNAKLSYPPLYHSYEHYPSNDPSEGPELMRLRAHVHKICHRIKKYHIFDSELNLSLAGTLNQLWAVCCILTNFHGLDSCSLYK